MKPQNVHAQEDRLLDFAYGELPVPEARLVEAHLQGCARCTQALDDIRGVRATMSQLAVEPAPDAGLESLMAYAQQAARRAAAGPEPKPSRWRRWLLPVVGLASVSTFGILTLQAQAPELTRPDLSAATAAPQAVKDERRAPASSDEFAPAPTAAAPAPAEAPTTPPMDDGFARNTRREVAAPSKKSMEAVPPSVAKLRAEDWSNAGSGGGLDMRMRGERESKGKRMGPAPTAAVPKVDMARKAPGMEGAASLDEESGVSIGAMEPPAPKEVAAVGRAERRVPDSQAPGAVPPRDSLRIGSKSPAARGGASADAWAAEQEQDDAPTAGAALAEAPRSQSAPAEEKAAPPPPAPARPAPARPAEPAPSVAELSRQAREALAAGDNTLAAALIRSALAAGASGNTRLELLNQLCESEFALGRGSEAQAACNLVIQEAPGSGAARSARQLLSRESAPAKPVK